MGWGGGEAALQSSASEEALAVSDAAALSPASAPTPAASTVHIGAADGWTQPTGGAVTAGVAPLLSIPNDGR